ncbi:MAG: AAA family ATPase [DPANN group archaeon]|nr:AAA family ATPase [DPANN group archaeon]
MSYYIIIRGPLGIGKSTIAAALAKLLNAEHISMDKVLEENELDKEDNNFTSVDFIKADNIVLPKVRKDLKKGKIVIFDGCFYFKEHIKHLEKSIPAKCYAFNLKAPLETCIIRDSKRKKVYGEENAKAVYEMVSRFNYGIPIQTGKKTVAQVVKEILKHLPA